MNYFSRYWLDRVFGFFAPYTFKWLNGVGTLIVGAGVVQAVTGELIVVWFAPNIKYVSASLMHLKYSVPFGSFIYRIHHYGISLIFVLVFFHLIKAIVTGAFRGSRNTIWFSGIVMFILMYGCSYAGCILPWVALSPTLFTMVQTIVANFLGKWLVAVLFGGLRLNPNLLERVLIAHILLGLLIALFLAVHLRTLHLNGSSINRFFLFLSFERTPWYPSELLKELILWYLFIITFLFLLQRKVASYGSIKVTIFKFLYGNATNWNPLPSSIEPEWYFWVFYFILANASSLVGGLVRMGILFGGLMFLPILFDVVDFFKISHSEEFFFDGFFSVALFGIFYIFYTRAPLSFWHAYFLDLFLFSLWVGLPLSNVINMDFDILSYFNLNFFLKKNLFFFS